MESIADEEDEGQERRRAKLALAAMLIVVIVVTIVILGFELAKEASEQHAKEVRAQAAVIACTWNCRPYEGVLDVLGRCLCRDNFMKVVRMGGGTS